MLARTIKTATSLSFVALLALSFTALAGGFQLSVEAPRSNDPEMQDAALVIRTFGCQVPADANVSATAEGIVRGQRQSLPLELRATSTGVYTIRQQWPSEGRWVISISGHYHGITSSLLVDTGRDGKVEAEFLKEEKQSRVRRAARKFTPSEIVDALKGRLTRVGQTENEMNTAASNSFQPGALVAAGLGAVVSVAGLIGWRRRTR